MFDVQLAPPRAAAAPPSAGADGLTDPLHDALAAPSGGQALPEALQQTLGQSFQADFSGVQVAPQGLPSDSPAAAMAHNGRLLFKPGQYKPDSADGKKMIAHELAHLVQQDVGQAPSGGGDDPVLVDPQLEAGADQAGEAALAGNAPGVGLGGRKPKAAPVAQGWWQVILGQAVATEAAKRGVATLAQGQINAAVAALEGEMVEALRVALARPEVQAEIQRLAALSGAQAAMEQMVRELAAPLEQRARDQLAALAEHMPEMPKDLIANPFPNLTARVSETFRSSWVGAAAGAVREAAVAMGAHSVVDYVGGAFMDQGAAALRGQLTAAVEPATQAVAAVADQARTAAGVAKAAMLTRNPVQKAANYVVGAAADAALGPIPEVGAGVAEAVQGSAQSAVARASGDAAKQAADQGSMIGPVVQALTAARDYAGADTAAGKAKALTGAGAAVGGVALAPVALAAVGVASAPAVAVVGTAAAGGYVLKVVGEGAVDYVSKHYGNKISDAVSKVDQHAPVVSGAVRAASHGVDTVGNAVNLAGSLLAAPVRALTGSKQTIGDNFERMKYSAASAVGLGAELVPSAKPATPAASASGASAPPAPRYEDIDVESLDELQPGDEVVDVIMPTDEDIDAAPEAQAKPDASAAAPAPADNAMATRRMMAMRMGMFGSPMFMPGLAGSSVLPAYGAMRPRGPMGSGLGMLSGPMWPGVGGVSPVASPAAPQPVASGGDSPQPVASASGGVAPRPAASASGGVAPEHAASPVSSAGSAAAPASDFRLEVDDSAAWANFFRRLEGKADAPAKGKV